MNKTDKKYQPSQKITRAPTQTAEAALEKSKQARAARIKSHNIWPRISKSQAEQDFAKLIIDLAPSIFLTPYPFVDTDDSKTADFHRHLGMLVDALEMLPERPDHAFDIAFRVLDELSQLITSKGNITDALGALGAFVCNNLASKESWNIVINTLCTNMPPVSGRYLAQRLLEAIPLEKDSLKNRAESILGSDFCVDFYKKYRTDLPLPSTSKSSDKITSDANYRAGEFLCLLLSKREEVEKPPLNNIYKKLDLSKKGNLIDESTALSALTSLFAFTARNERVHGSSLSPFRSSQASLTTYSSYYFQFQMLYAISTGLMVELFPGCGDQEKWLKNIDENMKKYQLTLGKYSRSS